LFHILESLYLAPNGRPKYLIGSEATPHPRILANLLRYIIRCWLVLRQQVDIPWLH
jgi:hypothetical protein